MARQKKVVFEYIEALLLEEDAGDSGDLSAEAPTEPPEAEQPDVVAAEPSDLITDEEFEAVLDQLQAEGKGAFAAPAPSATEEPTPETEVLSDEEIAAAMEASIAADLEASSAPDEAPVSEAVAAPASEPVSEPASESIAESKGPSALAPIERRPKVNCVLIDMHGMRLAIPFEHMENAYSFSDCSLSIQGLPDWVIGKVETERDSIQIVDTALLLIPQHYKPEYAEYREFLILSGRHWALACDGLVKSVQIPHDEINWNESRAGRPWLVGTHMGERCAILDIPYLIEMFEAGC